MMCQMPCGWVGGRAGRWVGAGTHAGKHAGGASRSIINFTMLTGF